MTVSCQSLRSSDVEASASTDGRRNSGSPCGIAMAEPQGTGHVARATWRLYSSLCGVLEVSVARFLNPNRDENELYVGSLTGSSDCCHRSRLLECQFSHRHFSISLVPRMRTLRVLRIGIAHARGGVGSDPRGMNTSPVGRVGLGLLYSCLRPGLLSGPPHLNAG